MAHSSGAGVADTGKGEPAVLTPRPGGEAPARGRGDTRPGRLRRTVGDSPLVLALIALTVVLVPSGSGTREPAGFFLLDAPMIALGVVSAVSGVRGIRNGSVRIGPGTALFTLMWLLLAVAHLSDPTPNGSATLLRLLSAFLVVRVIARLETLRAVRVLGATMVAVACAESVLALLQVARRAPLGWTALGERSTRSTRWERQRRPGVPTATRTSSWGSAWWPPPAPSPSPPEHRGGTGGCGWAPPAWPPCRSV